MNITNAFDPCEDLCATCYGIGYRKECDDICQYALDKKVAQFKMHRVVQKIEKKRDEYASVGNTEATAIINDILNMVKETFVDGESNESL